MNGKGPWFLNPERRTDREAQEEEQKPCGDAGIFFCVFRPWNREMNVDFIVGRIPVLEQESIDLGIYPT
ncbi:MULTISPECIES: hypothetical protein [Rhodonellum]|uniref:hypothetical protein n=1 Tax=Rhodonellum TaxID=336827 RepID=UPI00037C8259|nr:MULTISPECIES: hypothetical protein [Rhodonellum]